MRRRRSFFDGWYAAPPKQPVPTDGIAADRFGATWWGREWIAALERLGRTWSNRLPRGRSYARQGRVVDLNVGAGEVTAGVVGTRPRPYRVIITLPVLDGATWRRGVESVADDAMLVIRLLERELPDQVGERFREAGVDLFPTRGELGTRCTCPDVANPCKHVAAVHYLFAAALDNDPFLLFRLRGLDQAGLMAAVAGDESVNREAAAAEQDVDADELEVEEGGTPDVAAFLGRDTPPPVVDVEPRAPRVELVGLKRLGPPPRGLEGLPEALARTIRAAGRRALELAWGDDGPKAPATPPAPRGRRTAGNRGEGPAPRRAPAPLPEHTPTPALPTRLEAVLADAPRPLSKRELVANLGVDAAQVNAALQELRRAGLVTAHGRGPATRYALTSRSAPGRERGGRPRAVGEDLPGRVVGALSASRTALSLRSLAEHLGYTPDELRPVIFSLRQNGVVELVGRRRSARYRVRRSS